MSRISTSKLHYIWQWRDRIFRLSGYVSSAALHIHAACSTLYVDKKNLWQLIVFEALFGDSTCNRRNTVSFLKDISCNVSFNVSSNMCTHLL